MTLDDISRIERELNIRLPDSYRNAVVPFPIPACVGNDDTELWDNADSIIEYNREVRQGLSGGVAPWPVHFFALGRDGSGSSSVLDLRHPDGPVWWADRGNLNIANDTPGASFAIWVTGYLAELRADLEGNDINPDGTPEEREKKYAEQAHGSCLITFVLIAAALAFAVGLIAAFLWRPA
jgi:hypothetical protein